MRTHDTGALDAEAERAVVVRLLEDTTQPVPADKLYSPNAPNIDAARLRAAVASLEAVGVVTTDPEGVRVAPSLRRLDDLRLVAI